VQTKSLGRLGEVSALTLGGGGFGSVFGAVDRDEAIATVRAGIDAGITLLDLAPSYGPNETPQAETIVGEAFGKRLPEHVRVTSKIALYDPAVADEIPGLIRDSLRETLQRIGREQLDVLLLHSAVRPAGAPPSIETFELEMVRDVVIPEFERLVQEGAIASWGLTGTAHPDAICELIEGSKPTAVQCVVNALDALGDLWPPHLQGAPDNARVRAAAVANGASVMGIRAIASGSLAAALDREVPDDHPAARDLRRAAGFRALARERGETPSLLAYRYALAQPGIATLVLGAKNRDELAEGLAAEAAPTLSEDELREIESACEQGGIDGTA
jgi:aryl-alcohol dehydrogenase-like predicted oxidoreductase